MKDYEQWIKFIAEESDEIEIDQGNGDDCDVLICRLKTEPLLVADNLLGNCSKCHRLVQFRPSAPRRPPKLCDECALTDIIAAKARGEGVRTTVTRNTARDFADYFRKKKMH